MLFSGQARLLKRNGMGITESLHRLWDEGPALGFIFAPAMKRPTLHNPR
jgi:hypothetical protein